MRVVLDTNVIVAAGFSGKSASAALVERVRRGELELVWNAVTRDETTRLLRQIPPLRSARFADLYAGAPFEGETHPSRYPLLDGRLDREFAALAAAADAVLVSSDDDFLSVRDRLDVAVCTPSELLARLAD